MIKEKSNEVISEANFIINEEFLKLPDEQIETVYGPLFFSGQWKDKMTAEVINNDVETEVIFYGQADSKKEKMFAIFWWSIWFPYRRAENTRRILFGCNSRVL